MKNKLIKYLELLKNKHFFLLLAIVTSFSHAIIQTLTFIIVSTLWIRDFNFTENLNNLSWGILIFMSPFVMVWIISYFSVISPQKIKFLNRAVSAILNSFIIIIIQCFCGYYITIFSIVF